MTEAKHNIVERLKAYAQIPSTGVYISTMQDAADEIERLRKALKKIEAMSGDVPDWIDGLGWEYQWVAREALEGK